MSAPRCARCGHACEAWALAQGVCIMCRLLRLGHKAQQVARLSPAVPWNDLLRILLPRPKPGETGIPAADRWERAARTPIETLAEYVTDQWQNEQEARLLAETERTLVQIEEWDAGWLEVTLGGEVVFEGGAWDTLAVLHLLEALGVPVRHTQHHELASPGTTQS